MLKDMFRSIYLLCRRFNYIGRFLHASSKARYHQTSKRNKGYRLSDLVKAWNPETKNS